MWKTGKDLTLEMVHVYEMKSKYTYLRWKLAVKKCTCIFILLYTTCLLTLLLMCILSIKTNLQYEIEQTCTVIYSNK